MSVVESTARQAPKRKSLKHGLYLRRDGRYEHGYTDPGSGKWHVVTLQAATKTEARKEIADRVSRLSQGRVAAPSRITLSEFAVEFFAAMDGLVENGERSARTRDLYRQRWRTHIEPRLGRLPVQAITPAHVARMLREVRAAGAASWTAHGILTALGSILEHARTRGLISESPVRRLAKGEKPTAKNVRTVRILTPDQVATLLASGTPTWTPFLTTVAYTGLRASEALGLRWQDVDTTAGVLHVRNQLGRDGTLLPLKTEESARSIPMAPDLRKTLLEARVASGSSLPTGFVFATETGRPQSYANARRAFDNAVEKAKLGDGETRLTLHALRHTFASALIAAGVDVVRVSTVLGHAKVSTTLDTYAAQFNARGAHDMGDVIGAAFGGVAGVGG